MLQYFLYISKNYFSKAAFEVPTVVNKNKCETV
jgi:hypothetical protein